MQDRPADQHASSSIDPVVPEASELAQHREGLVHDDCGTVHPERASLVHNILSNAIQTSQSHDELACKKYITSKAENSLSTSHLHAA